MPPCGATFDENTVPPWTRGGERGNKPSPLSRWFDPGRRTRHTNHPRRGRWPGIPSSTEEGSLFSEEAKTGM